MQHTKAPTLERPLDRARAIPDIVDAVIGAKGLSGIARPPTPMTLELLGLALSEVLHTVLEHCGEHRAAGAASVELWIERRIVIIVIKFDGPPLPKWLLANWDRGEEPAVPATPADCGWGWLLVREALESVDYGASNGRQLVFLEKRL